MKLTNNQFHYFVKECKKRVVDFGLQGWDISYEFNDHSESLAYCTTRFPTKSATIGLSSNWKSYRKVTNEDLRITAVHEVTHLLVAELDSLGRHRYVNEDDIVQANETIANTMVNFMRKYKII